MSKLFWQRGGLRDSSRLSPKSFDFYEASTTDFSAAIGRCIEAQVERIERLPRSTTRPIRSCAPTQRGFASEKCCTQTATRTSIRNDRSSATPKLPEGLPIIKKIVYIVIWSTPMSPTWNCATCNQSIKSKSNPGSYVDQMMKLQSLRPNKKFHFNDFITVRLTLWHSKMTLSLEARLQWNYTGGYRKVSSYARRLTRSNTERLQKSLFHKPNLQKQLRNKTQRRTG